MAMPGVVHTEPMHGFNFSFDKLVASADFSMAHYGKNSRPKEPRLEFDGTVSARKRRLFAGFTAREQIKAFARLAYATGLKESVQMLLFVNFKNTHDFTQREKSKIETCLKATLAPLLGSMREELTVRDTAALSKSIRVLSPDKTIAIQDVQLLSSDVNGYLQVILKNTFDAFGLDEANDLGTIYLYDPELAQLEIAASLGVASSPPNYETRSVAKAEGIVAWVVYRQTALLIENLDNSKSAYANIHVSLKPDMKSELAVPMIIGEEVVGVICLESSLPNKFAPTDVRPIWYAANRAAVACRFYQQMSLNRELIGLCSAATEEFAESKLILAKLAIAAQRHMRASDCDVWRFETSTGQLIEAGASYTDEEPNVRENGWSKYVLNHKCPVWIHAIKSVAEFEVVYFCKNEWSKAAPSESVPEALNNLSLQAKTSCELGLPLIVRGECIGVAWISYRRWDREHPGLGLMTLARGFMAEAALVMEALKGQRDRGSRAGIEFDIGKRMKDNWQLADHPLVEAAVATQAAEATLGGDFYAGIQIDPSRIGVLIGDGEGHATRGSLNMLALFSAFEASRDSCSTVYVMEHIARMARVVGVRGTGIYGILTHIGDVLSLSATSAGHEPYIILRRKKSGMYEHFDLPVLDSVASGLMFGVARIFCADIQELHVGDILIACTDGVSGSLGRETICSIAGTALEADKTMQEVTALILEKALRGQADGAPVDDATVIMFRVKDRKKAAKDAASIAR